MSTLELAFVFYFYREKFKKELEDFSAVAKEKYFLPPGEKVRRIGDGTIVAIIREGWENDDEQQILKGLKMAYVWADTEKHRLNIKAAMKDILDGVV